MRNRLRNDRGAEAIELAIAAPVLLLLVCALLYVLMALASQVSLTHAASVGARYAALPLDVVQTTYPTPAEVAAKVDSATPFFDASACTSSVMGDEQQNAPVTLDVACTLPNPIGGVMDALTGSSSYSGGVTISARASARRE